MLLKNNREVNALTIKQKAMFFTKITNYCRASLFVIFIITLLVACGQDPVDNGNDNTDTDSPENSDGYEDIKVVDGKVRFYISEKENSTRTASGLSARNGATSTVVVNGKSYPVEFTDEQTPRPYIEVMESNNYNAVLQTPSSSMWFGSFELLLNNSKNANGSAKSPIQVYENKSALISWILCKYS